MIFLLSSTGPSTKAPSYVRQGLDTYLTKPFRAAELVERVSAVLEDRVASVERRDQKVLRAGPIVLDDESQGLKVAGKEVGITPTEFRLIWYLTEHAGTPVPPEDLLIKVWGFRPHTGEAALVRAHIAHIREKLARAGVDSGFLQTVSRRGYRIANSAGHQPRLVDSAHRFLITGATEFIGQRLVAALLDAGRQPIRCLVNDSDDVQVLEGRGLELAYGSLAEGHGLAEAVAGVHTLVNLAVCWRPQGVETYESVNHQGVRRLMEAAKAAGVKQVIHLCNGLGGGQTIDDPKYPYMNSRHHGGLAVIESGIPYTIIEHGAAFGPGDLLTEGLARFIRRGSAMPIGARSEVRLQPIHADDLVRCVIALIENPRFENQTVDLGGPEHLTFREVVDVIKQRLGYRGPLPLLSVKAARAIAVTRKLLRIRHGQTLASFELLARDSVTNLNIVPRLFGFQPRRLRDNIDYLEQDPSQAPS
jgi:NADH dehydrogenase